MANLIKKYPVPLLFKKALKDGLTGELIIKGEGFTKTLYFLKGHLHYATSTLKEDWLSEILFRKKKIQREQYIALNKIMQTTKAKYGKLLVQNKILTRQELFFALQGQTRTIAISTFKLTSGEWTFTVKKKLQIPSNPKFEIEIPGLISEAVKSMKDFAYFKHRYTFRTPVTLPIDEETGKLMNPDEIRFYVKLTKCQTITCEQVFIMMEIEENAFWRFVAKMYLLNVLDFAEFRVDSKVNENIEYITDLHEKLRSDSMSLYDVLQLRDTASIIDVQQKYFSFSKNLSPEKMHTAPDSAVKEKADFVFGKVQEAFDTLGDEKKKKAYDTGLLEKKKVEEALQKAQESARKKEQEEEEKRKEEQHRIDQMRQNNLQKARTFYLRANALYEQARYQEAARIMDEAVRLDGSRASYFLLLGLSQAQIPSLRPYAEKNLKKVAEMEPWNADPYFHLGKMYWAEKLQKKAETYFRKALELNMEHTMAGKMVRKIEKYTGKKQLFSLFGKKK